MAHTYLSFCGQSKLVKARKTHYVTETYPVIRNETHRHCNISPKDVTRVSPRRTHVNEKTCPDHKTGRETLVFIYYGAGLDFILRHLTLSDNNISRQKVHVTTHT